MMKKKLCFLMMAVFFLGMTACSDDDDDKKEAVAGTYTGTITVTDEAGTPIGEPLTGQKITIVDAGKDRINLELKDFKFGTVPVGDLEIKNVAVNDKGEVNGSASQVPIMNGVLQADITVSGTVKELKFTIYILFSEPKLRQSAFLFSLIFRFIEILLPGIRTFPSRAIVFEFSSRTALECLWVIDRARTYSRW